MVYDYVIVDTKLLAYQSGYHRFKPATALLPILVRALQFNDIKFKRVLYAGDWNKSSYRLNLQKDYKGHRATLHAKDTTQDQLRRKEFLQQYLDLHKIFNYVGTNCQDINAQTEADDMYTLVRSLYPEANILLISLDQDWYFNVDDKTHLLKYTKNELFTTQEQVEELYGMTANNLMDYSAITGQAKDNIHGLVNMGQARFKKFLLGKPKEEWWTILEDLIDRKVYNIHLSPLAREQTIFQQYHLNLLLMSPMPPDKHTSHDLKYIKDQLAYTPNTISYEEFLTKGIEIFNGIILLSSDDFNLLRNGNA